MTFRSRYEIWAISTHFVTAPYTPQGGTEQSAVPGISAAMLFFATA